MCPLKTPLFLSRGNVTWATATHEPSNCFGKLAYVEEWGRRNALKVCLGGRESNPDNMLQRQSTYRRTTSQYRSRRSERNGTFDYSRAQTHAASTATGLGCRSAVSERLRYRASVRCCRNQSCRLAVPASGDGS